MDQTFVVIANCVFLTGSDQINEILFDVKLGGVKSPLKKERGLHFLLL